MREFDKRTAGAFPSSSILSELSDNKKHLKLYVWTDFCPDYTSGLAVAVAHDESQARKLVQDRQGWEPYDWGTLSVYEIEPQAFCVCGGG